MLHALLSIDQSFTNWYPDQSSQCLLDDPMAHAQQFSGPTFRIVLPDGNYAPPVFMPGIPSQESMLQAVDKLKYFLATAPTSSIALPTTHRTRLPEKKDASIDFNFQRVSGTDIVRALHFRFTAFGRPVRNAKKFEEGIFSDLRNLKSGTDATLEEPKSDFLELLFKYNCIRTQKKQKVFYWFSVPHDRLFLDALDRDLKREKLGVEPTTEAVAEPALSFVYNPNKSLFEQFTEQKALEDGEGSVPAESDNKAEEDGTASASSGWNNGCAETARPFKKPMARRILLVPSSNNMAYRSASGLSSIASADEYNRTSSPPSPVNTNSSAKLVQTFAESHANSILGNFSLFVGSPHIQTRRKPGQKRPIKKHESSPASLLHSASMPGAELFPAIRTTFVIDNYAPRQCRSTPTYFAAGAGRLWCIESIRLPTVFLWSSLQASRALETTHADTYQRETLPMRALRKAFCKRLTSKIHEKLAARAGSTSSSDQRALEAEEELDERMSSFLESMENGLPTPPNAYPDQASCWPQYHGYPSAGAVLTPDQSPDPPNIYGLHSHGARPHSMESNFSFAPDNRRFRSATPGDIRGMDNYRGTLALVPHHNKGCTRRHHITILRLPLQKLHQFQAQLNMVNSLHAEIESEALMRQTNLTSTVLLGYVHQQGYVTHESTWPQRHHPRTDQCNVQSSRHPGHRAAIHQATPSIPT
ncbi:hypothetical protein Pst134EB_018878 [Puccinia striiformis f. sp. tritici]|nr:hypothetical protein Pst134EB_018878 [Puccinia striiformis f. sp. tritici]